MFDQITLSREESSIIIACLEVLIMAVFAYLITRLDFYEKLSSEDMRYGQLQIQDFSLLVKQIPISKKDY